MKSEEVIAIIEVICDKLGIAMNSMKDIVPMLAKYEIAMCIYWSIASIIVIGICLMIIKRFVDLAKKQIEKEKTFLREKLADFPSVMVSGIAGGLLIFIFAITMLLNIADLIGWMVSAETMAIKYVMSLL